MSNMIRFLEQAGQGKYTKAQMQSAISSLDLDPAQRHALSEGDIEALATSIGGRGAMRCLIATPD